MANEPRVHRHSRLHSPLITAFCEQTCLAVDEMAHMFPCHNDGERSVDDDDDEMNGTSRLETVQRYI
jgi:hypothetical protein